MRRGLSGSLAAIVLSTVVMALPPSGPPPAVAVPRTEVKCAAERPDRTSAALTAQLCGGQVEVADLRSETTQVHANPDGSFTARVHRAPVRTRQGDAWVPVDLTLRRGADGTVTPVAHPNELRLSGAAEAGSHDVASMTVGADRVAMSWSGTLPAPVLKGDTATYRDVRPGVDMTITATRTGFEQFFVIKTRSAVAQAATLNAPLHGSATTFEPAPGGGMVLKDKNGQVVGRSPAPLMWDAQVSPVTGDHTRVTMLRTGTTTRSAGQAELLTAPDQNWLTDPATKYPVTIDPQVNAGTLFDTYVKTGVDVDHSGANDLHVGYGSGQVARSFLQWDATQFVGTQITAATVYFWNWYSASCTASSWDIWTTDPTDGSARWTNQPTWRFREAASTSTHGYSTSCDDNWSTIDGKAFFQRAADSRTAGPFMGVRATTESDTNSWKQFRSRNAASAATVPYAVVTYNRLPEVSTVSTGPPTPCVTGAGRPYVNTVTPTLGATVSDADGSTVRARFQWWNTGGSLIGEAAYPGGLLAAGSTFTTTVPAGAFSAGGTYSWRVLGNDGLTDGAWSAWCEFTVDTAAPATAPSVASANYPAGDWSLGAGQPGTFSFGAASVPDVAAYLYGLDQNPPTTTAAPAALGGPATVSLTPLTDGPHTLYVRSRDRAGNVSPLTSYTFYAGSAAVTAPVDGDRPVRETVLAAAGPANTTGVTFQYRRSDAEAWVEVPAGNVRRRSDGATVSWPVPVTGGKSPDLVWTVSDTVPGSQLLQVRAALASAAGVAYARPVRLVVDPQAAKAAKEDVGPGSLNLVTGDFRLSGTDSAAFGMGLSRTATSRDPATALQSGQAPIFGKQWVFGYLSASSSINVAWLRRPTTTTVEVHAGGGTVTRFAQSAAGDWRPEPGADNLALAFDSGADRFTLTDVVTGAYVTFAKAAAGVSAYAVTSSGLPAENSAFTYVHETVTGSDAVVRTRPKRIVAPTTAAPAATCAADPSVRGCRVFELVYATTTTTTGDYAGQVRQARVWTTAPGATASTATTVAQYAYDADGNLRETWDPRLTPALKTRYTYDAAGRVATMTPAGLLPWTFGYGTAGSASTSGPGMLLSVSRPTLQPGSATQTNGTARTSVVYDVPTTRAQAGPYDLAAADVARWGQQTMPTGATAVFPADAVPAANTGRGNLTSGAYTRAAVYYLDRNGLEINSATPGGHIAVTEYNGFGQIVRVLTPQNRDLALGVGPDAPTQLAMLGLTSSTTAQRAVMLSSATGYGADPLAATETLGPVHTVALADLLPASGGLPALPAGSQVAARGHSVYIYDQGRPTNGTARTSHLVTRTASGATVTGYPTDGDVRLDDTEYDWTLGARTRTIGDPTGLALAETRVYDRQGRLVETRMPASTGNDDATTLHDYYTADGAAPCGGRPEWADLECRTRPKAPITGGGTNPAELVTTTTTYTASGETAEVGETANGVTRTTTTTYDPADRPVTVTVAGGVGDPVPVTTTTYDPATGMALRTVDADGAQIVNEYDDLGRLVAYTDAAGARTTYQYDALDRKILATDSAGTSTTYTYDVAVEPRGLLTATTDSVAGTFSAGYDANGTQVSQTLPGGVQQKTTVDQIGMPVARSYTTAGGAPIAADTLTVDIDGHWVKHTGLSTQTYTSDALGRVVQADDVSDDVCTRRGYGFGSTAGSDSNRVSKTTAVGAPGAACPEGGTTQTHSYDAADRIVDPGYSYDAFGRTVAMPGGLTVTYQANDQVRRQTAGDTRQTWTTDPAGRPVSFTVEVLNGSTWTTARTKVNHYRDDGDRPDRIVEDTATGQVTRNVQGTDGQLAATTSATGGLRLALTDLHGDVAVVYDPTAVTADVRGTDEYGVPKAGLATDRYGWLGGQQRSQEALGGTMLMGARVYDPTTGRFLQTDPITGGSANAYDYCSGDPASCADTTGLGTCSAWGMLCGIVKNYTNRYMRTGEIHSYNGGSCRIFDVVGWRTYWHAKCSWRGLPSGRTSRQVGLRDADIGTFSATGWFLHGIWMSQKEFVKLRDGQRLNCEGGRFGLKPKCRFGWGLF